MKRLLATGLAAGMLLTACTSNGGDTTNPPMNLPIGGGVLAAGTLVQFSECDQLLEHLQDQAVARVTAYGLPGQGWFGPVADGFAEVEQSLDGASQAQGGARATSGAGLVAGEDFSTTNVQEAGVDEPDIMKTDGQILVTVVQQVLHVVDLTGDEPVEVATMRLPDDMGDPKLMLDGDRLLVTGQRWGGFFGVPEPLPVEPTADIAEPVAPQTPITLIRLIDLSNPADPDVVADLELDGTPLSSRMVDGIIHVAISSQPTGLVFEYPTDSGVRGERDAIERNKEIIRDSTIEDWLPAYAHRVGDGDESVAQLVACDKVHSPDEFAGFGTLSIVSIDPADDDLVPRSAVGVLSEGHTVYGSTERLYVSTTDWVDWAAMDEDVIVERARDISTDVHAFDITRPQVTYTGSGSVPGSLLNQFSMSEHDGHLRVATTEGNQWWTGDDSVSTVTVLEIADDELAEVGSVTGLGETERIFAVRFLGDVGYVVTFRQIDPLYVLDLSDPTDPRVTGELKIPGYSAYLHPAGDGRLIGVGQDATDEGRVTGLQVSLFDVSDPEDPQRLSKVTMADAHSESEFNHHAFLYWPATGTTVLPMQQWNERFVDDVIVEEDTGSGGGEPETSTDAPAPPPDEEPTARPLEPEPDFAPELVDVFNGAVVLDVAEDGISVEGRISHVADASQQWNASIRRSFVHNGVLYTLSDQALVGVDLDTLEARSRLDW